MNEDVRNLLLVQGLDDEIAVRSAEIDSLPRHIADIRKRLHAHQSQLKTDKDALAANQKQMRDLEGQVADHKQKISRLRDQMMQAKTNEQYKAFQHEIEFHEKAIRAAEDREIELMESAEALGTNVKIAEAALATEEASVKAESTEAEKRIALIRAERDQLETERKQTLQHITREVRAAYDALKARGRRQVVATIEAGNCTACRMSVRLQLIQDLQLSDKLIRCENCLVYLYATRVTAVDEHGPSTSGIVS
ncbi:MAG: hypothetical protein MUF01_14460 [Bryobacterales bacterium]|jgi:hypothetical protein|nr:hypothetical protein [Bryobacterales bacterium]